MVEQSDTEPRVDAREVNVAVDDAQDDTEQTEYQRGGHVAQ